MDPLGHTFPCLEESAPTLSYPNPNPPPTKGRSLIPKLLEEKLEAPFSSAWFCGLLSAYVVSGKVSGTCMLGHSDILRVFIRRGVEA